MYDPEMRKDCPMRGNLGNCSPVGGFCMDAVSDEICEAVHNAYNHGFHDAVRTLKEQRTTVEVVSVTKENGSVNLFAFNESSDAIKCFCYWKDKGATVTCGEVDIQ